MSDKRRHPRVLLPSIGKVDLGGRILPCILLDVSEGGMGLLTAAGEQVDGPVQVSFRLGGPDAAQAWIDAEVVCQRDDRCGMSSRWSLRSLPMDLGTRTRLRDYIHMATPNRAA